MTQFGCPLCYGEDPEIVSTNHHAVRSTDGIIAESHFMVSLNRCPECGQRFLRVFTEFVDWQGGDDAQYVDVVPITEEEAAAIVRQGEDVDLRYLRDVGTGRRRLSIDWPSNRPRRIGWRAGVFEVREGG
jgi:hypothetical protein